MELKAKIKEFANFTTFWITITIVYVSLFAIEYFVLSEHSQQFDETKLNWGLITFLFQILYTVAGFRIVGPTELGARLFLEIPLTTLHPA